MLGRYCLYVIILASFSVQISGKLCLSEIKPEVAIVIRKHPVGADMVEITMLDPAYPSSVLHERCIKLAELLEGAPRGLEVFHHILDPGRPNLRFLKATFAIDGVISNKTHLLRLEPIVKAFTGIPRPHRVQSMSIHFADQIPPKQAIKQLHSEAVHLMGRSLDYPKGIEYLVEIKDQNPDHIHIPVSYQATSLPSVNHRSSYPWWKFFAIVCGALSIGLLVYIYLLRFVSGSLNASKRTHDTK